MADALPQEHEAELATLAAAVSDNASAVTVAAALAPGDFYDRRHQLLAAAVHDLVAKREPVDLVSVMRAAKGAGTLEDIGGPGYLAEVANSFYTSAHLDHHIGLIREAAGRRRLVMVADQIRRLAFDLSGDLEATLGHAEQLVLAVGDHRHSSDLVDLRQILSEYYTRLEEGTASVTVGTGLVDLDRMLLGGFRPGQLIVLAARPSMGKSGLATTFVANVAAKGAPVAVFSLEMSKDENAGRLLANAAKVNGARLSTGALLDNDWNRIAKAMGQMGAWPVAIDDTGRVTIPQLGAKLRRFQSRYGRIGLVVVDYLQLMDGSGKDGRQNEISAISRGLKQLAREFTAPVLALSQLNRKSEERQDKRPMMSDLRDSGSIEQDADIVMLLHRPGYYERGTAESTSGPADVHVAKHRNGPVGTVSLYFNRDLASFSNLSMEF